MTELHLVSWNRPRMTNLVIRTIHRNTPRDQFHLLVLDNGSDKETTDMLRQLKDDKLIDGLILWDENLGLEAGRNELLQYAKMDYFVDIDNDCLPPPIMHGHSWLQRQLDLMEKYEDYAAISQRTQVMIGTGNIFEEADSKSQDLLDFPHPGGSFRLMRRKAVEEVGGWDRNAPGRGSEERYICGKLREAGYKTGFAVQIPCHHLFGTRFIGGDRNTDRWGYDQSLKPEDTGHSDIAHPALSHGDNTDEETMDRIRFYCGAELAEEYLYVNGGDKA